MTWAELKYAINQIPEERLNEKAVFVVEDGEDAWEIDALDYDGPCSWDDLESHSIFDENIRGSNPIKLTP